MNQNYHIVSHVVYTGKEVVKKGFITFNGQFEILKVESKDLSGAESARTQFFSGVVLPAIYLEETNDIHITNFLNSNLNPRDYKCINASGQRYNELLNTFKYLQEKHHLTGEAFLEFWNKLSVNMAQKYGLNYIVEPKNKLPLMNIQGVVLPNFMFSEKVKIREIRL